MQIVSGQNRDRRSAAFLRWFIRTPPFDERERLEALSRSAVSFYRSIDPPITSAGCDTPIQKESGCHHMTVRKCIIAIFSAMLTPDLSVHGTFMQHVSNFVPSACICLPSFVATFVMYAGSSSLNLPFDQRFRQLSLSITALVDCSMMYWHREGDEFVKYRTFLFVLTSPITRVIDISRVT